MVVRPVVAEIADAHDGIEEVLGERQRPGVRVDGKHAVLGAGIADALEVLRGALPQVGGLVPTGPVFRRNQFCPSPFVITRRERRLML